MNHIGVWHSHESDEVGSEVQSVFLMQMLQKIQDHLANNKREKQAAPGLIFKKIVWLQGDKMNHLSLIKMSQVKSICWEEHTKYAGKVMLKRDINN